MLTLTGATYFTSIISFFVQCTRQHFCSLECFRQNNQCWASLSFSLLLYLGIHRLAQAPCQEVPWDPSGCRNGPCSFDNQRLISKENGPLQHQELEGASELSVLSQLGSSSMSNGFSKENGSNVSESCQKPPLKSAASAVWMQQYISSTKCTPACHKLDFYPFPNKKAPRISEAARRLGLYVSR